MNAARFTFLLLKPDPLRQAGGRFMHIPNATIMAGGGHIATATARINWVEELPFCVTASGIWYGRIAGQPKS